MKFSPGRHGDRENPRRALDLRDFPGCLAIHLPAEDLDSYEGRIEYWEARSSTAIVRTEPPTAHHERLRRRLGGLVREILLARDAEIARAEGALEVARASVRHVFKARGVPVTGAVDAWLARLDSSTDTAPLIAAAVRCRDAADFLHRVRPAADAPPDDG